MQIAGVIESMIRFYHKNRRDISHFLKVYAYAKTIGELEGLPPKTQEILEIAAAVHDIACPLCREKYGHADGKMQEKEGPALAAALLEEVMCPAPIAERVCWLVGHHHTYTDVDGLDHRILLEADYLVNADEGAHQEESIRAARQNFFRTEAGIRLLDSIYGAAE